jgi:hypothetical protein
MKSLSRQLLFIAPTLVLFAALAAHAQTSACPGGTGTCLTSPLSSSLSSIPAFLSAALSAMVKIALPIITVFIVYSGFLFVTAQGNQAKLAIAKTNFFYAVLGALLILSAWVLANLIGGTVTQLLG